MLHALLTATKMAEYFERYIPNDFCGGPQSRFMKNSYKPGRILVTHRASALYDCLFFDVIPTARVL